MLDIGWSELLVVAIVAIVVVGPKDLPKLMRTLGVYAGKVRRAASDFQRQFEEAMAESEADEVRKNIEAIRANMGTTADFADKPIMLPTEPARTALGAPPLGTSQPPEKASARKSRPKTTGKKTKKSAPRSAKRQANAKPKRKTKAKPKTKTKVRPKR